MIVSRRILEYNKDNKKEYLANLLKGEDAKPWV
jgi:hypothetical protein